MTRKGPLKGYRTTKNPTGQEIIDAAIRTSWEAAILTNPEAARDSIGDAAYLHIGYNIIDEEAANMYAKSIGKPEGAFSSRLQADGSISDYPEDAKEARKRRSPEDSAIIDLTATDMWRKKYNFITRYYPYFALQDMGYRYINSHCYVRSNIGLEIYRQDDLAEQDDYTGLKFPSGEPSANLIAWMAAIYLVTRPTYFKTLFKEWIEYLDDPTTQTRAAHNKRNHIKISNITPGAEDKVKAHLAEYVTIDERHPDIHINYFELLDEYFNFHFEAIKRPNAGKLYFSDTLVRFMEDYKTPAIFASNIDKTTYERYTAYGKTT